jgi:hypothetical protein
VPEGIWIILGRPKPPQLNIDVKPNILPEKLPRRGFNFLAKSTG